MKNSFLLILICMATMLNISKAANNPVPLIPAPEKVDWLDGEFILSNNTLLQVPSSKLEDYLVSSISEFTGLKPDLNSKANTQSQIVLLLDSTKIDSGKEAYTLSVSPNMIEITSATEEGLFRGLQTFFQLIPPSTKAEKNGKPVGIPCCNIIDKPEFSWRGLSYDCSRHFMTKDFIKRYIDILAYYKFNILHWHLTDDQGWRIEIKKYPKLTQVGAWRKEADGTIYGGFYTQEDIKEIVAYAQSRFITVVPEIEMPGHSTASLTAYPENSCTGGPFEVGTTWGVFKDIYCAGRDSTFYFLQDVLDEVMTLFPGKYIHIGGDEAPKDRWKECPRCQARIKAEGLKNEEELQSYFIKRISNYLYSKGKEVIGWDEILQGGLAPGAVVQSWQGFEGADSAAAHDHYAICSPTSHAYLDYSPDNLDLRTVYTFEPIPKDLPADKRKYILGGEACLWTERAPQELVDNRLFPRLLALAEVFWRDPQNRNYDEFHSRVQMTYDDLTARGIKYGAESKTVTYSSSYDDAKKEFTVTVTSTQKDLKIRYTTDGSDPDLNSASYSDPIKIDKSVPLKIAVFGGNDALVKQFNLAFDFHKALNAKITLTNQYGERYSAGGDNAVIDGMRGTDNFRDGLWQGYSGVDFEGVIDLGQEKEISKVVPRFILDTSSWVFLPERVIVSLSNDGVNYTDEKIVENDVPQKNPNVVLKDFTAEFNNQSARYIKVKAVSIKKCPDWHPGAGQDAWMFIDEIVVE